jgi:signal transduction histidine kinase
MDTIGKLTGEVAHDFNNLLMTVLGSLALLEERLPEDPQCHRLLNIAVQGGQRGASLTKRLLTFSRRQELKPTSVDIGELVSGMQELLTRALGVGVELHCQFPSTLPPVTVDANQLELALLNMALNARDAMPDGGIFMISAEEISGQTDLPLAPGDYVHIRVADTGVGMDEAACAELWLPQSITHSGSGLRFTAAGMPLPADR